MRTLRYQSYPAHRPIPRPVQSPPSDSPVGSSLLTATTLAMAGNDGAFLVAEGTECMYVGMHVRDPPCLLEFASAVVAAAVNYFVGFE